MTPEQWLPILAKRLDDRYPRIAELRSYAGPNPPMPEMTANMRASWVAFQRKACTGYGGLAISSLARRIKFNGILIGDSSDNPAVVAARRIWRDNRMGIVVADAIRDALTCSVGYLVVGTADGQAMVSREKPEQAIAAADPLRPWKARAFLKVWRDLDARKDFAYVYVPGMRQKFERPSWRDDDTIIASAAGEEWTLSGAPETYVGDPPVVILDRADGLSFIEPHIPVIDRINLGKLQRLVITAMQAYRQRALKKQPGTGDITKDADGNDVDLTAVFTPAPGALWDMPEGVDVWESQTADLLPLLEGEKTDARDFAAVTSTPMSVFIPEGANQSAEGAAAAKEGQVAQAEEEIDRLKPCIEVVIVYALRAEGIDLGDMTVDLLHVPPAHVSLSEKYDAASKAINVVSRKTIQRDILGMSLDQIAEDEENLASEQLQAFTLTGAPGGDL